MGNTDPAAATAKSLRGHFHRNWAEPRPQSRHRAVPSRTSAELQHHSDAFFLGGGGGVFVALRLGLPSQPHVGENAVHGSASPFEASFRKLCELSEVYSTLIQHWTLIRLDRPWLRRGTGLERTTSLIPLAPCFSAVARCPESL